MKNIKNLFLTIIFASVFSLLTASSVLAQTIPFPNTPKVGIGFGPTTVGIVSTINGKIITINSKQTQPVTGFSTSTPTWKTSTYTINTSGATILKDNTTGNLSNIKVGDLVIIQGIVSGKNITPTTIRDIPITIHSSSTPMFSNGKATTTVITPVMKNLKNKYIPKVTISSSTATTSTTTIQETNNDIATTTTDTTPAPVSKPGFFRRIWEFIIHLFGF